MIVLGGRRLEVPGLRSRNWLDDPALAPRAHDHAPRTRPVRGIVLYPLDESPRDPRYDFILTAGGTVLACNDPATSFVWHAQALSKHTVALAVVLTPEGGFYPNQEWAFRRLLHVLCEYLEVPEAIPTAYEALADVYLEDGANTRAIYARRHLSKVSSPYDDLLLDSLRDDGFTVTPFRTLREQKEGGGGP